MSCPDRQDILEAHNTARQNVALGRVTGQPAATNMLEMVSVIRWLTRAAVQRERERKSERVPVKRSGGDEKTAKVYDGQFYMASSFSQIRIRVVFSFFLNIETVWLSGTVRRPTHQAQHPAS